MIHNLVDRCAPNELDHPSVKLVIISFTLSLASDRSTPITLRKPEGRGCPLSILAHEHPKALHKELEAAGVKADFREPNVIRAAPAPLYNSFHDVWRFSQILTGHQ